MKKFAIIGISVVALIAIVCVGAFAWWDTTKSDVTFEGPKVASPVKLNVTNLAVANDVLNAGKTLVGPDAYLKATGETKAKVVPIGATSLSITSSYDATTLASLVGSLKASVTAFAVADVSDITLDNFATTYDLVLNTAKDNAEATRVSITKAQASMSAAVLKELTDKKTVTLYAFLSYKVEVDGAKFTGKRITSTIKFDIDLKTN